MAFESELLSIFGQLAAQPAVEEHPVNVALQGIVEPPVIAPVVAPVVTPKVEPAPVVAPVAAIVAPALDLDAVIEDWDTPQVPVAVSPSPVDYSEIAKVLGLGDVKTSNEVISAITALKIKAEAQSKDLPVLPADLAKAVDIAKQGGNYLEYLKVSAVDWSKSDPVIMFQDWVYDRFGRAGKTAEEIEAYLEKVDDMEKEIRGQELINQYTQYQQNQRLSLETQAKLEKQEQDASVRRALDGLDMVFGFKLGMGHKEELFGDFTSTPIGRALLSQTGGDYKKALERLFLSKYGEKVDAVRRKQLGELAKRDLLTELQNPKITNAGLLTNPNTAPLDPIQMYLSELTQKTGL